MRTRMQVMAWLGSALVIWAAGSAVAVVAAPPPPLAAPLIASAQLNADQTTLTLTGLNFAATGGGEGVPPSVSLALTPLPVTASSATWATATLPSPLNAGTYLLVLQRGDEEAATFYVTVGAVGPPAPAGPAGGGSGAVWQ